jgi:hypothetical protein
MKKINKIHKWLIAYYGILQSLHILTLARAGIILWLYNKTPFPILPPAGGWTSQTMPFLYGLAGMDVMGILLGIIFAWQHLFKKQFKPILGLVSQTIFFSGAIVFAAGTFPTGAWSAHPLSYWLMVLLFVPIIPLYIKIISMIYNGRKQ